MALLLFTALCIGWGTPSRGAAAPGREANEPVSPAPTEPPPLPALIAQLGAEAFAQREAATQQITAIGPDAAPAVRAALQETADPEVVHRLRFILENISPPREALLVVRADPNSGLQPGDLITRINGRPVATEAELKQIMADTPGFAILQVNGPRGPQQVGPVKEAQLEALSEYRAPRGETLARVVRLYAGGLVEQAYDALKTLGEGVPLAEMDDLLRARIAFTAGDATLAWKLLEDDSDAVKPEQRLAQNVWAADSPLDKAGPGPAPFHIARRLFERAGPAAFELRIDPDIRVQRLNIPARRFGDAFGEAAELWWERFRSRMSAIDDTEITAAGNMLAVAGWMLSEMDLLSECCRLIKPRSAILTSAWLRVQTDAWLAFLAGDDKGALDSFYNDARQVLQRQPLANDRHALTKNPRVAAVVAFFLYQMPDDPRIADTLVVVNEPSHPALTTYADWMLFALQEQNAAAVARDLALMVPTLSDAQVGPYARALALLEYVRDRPRSEVFETARQRLSQTADTPQRATALTLIDALRLLAAGQPGAARDLLAAAPDERELAALRATAAFLADPPPTAANHAALANPLLAIPIGAGDERWLVLARDRRLLAFDAVRSTLTPIEKPSPTWYPGPSTWPWLGSEVSTGRAWVYDRRRVVEVPTSSAAGIRLNIPRDGAAAFDRHIGPHFSLVADSLGGFAPSTGETAEFLRNEIRAHREFVADPDLPEVALVQPLARDPRLLHVALRGGPHLLIDPARGKAWTAAWLAEQLRLPRPPTFFPVAAVPIGDALLDVFLLSDQGVYRFDTGAERLTRIDLPDNRPDAPVIPEWTPYERRDPRFVYCARLPEDGGQVFRIHVANNAVEAVDLVNESLPPGWYAVQSRAAIRTALDDLLRAHGMPGLQEFVLDAREVVDQWQQAHKPQ